ncbi:MAG: STAS/SEC14 domain-containing protein [Fibrobacteria bacterium]
MESIVLESVEMRWAPRNRLATLKYFGNGKPTGKDAEKLITAMTGWIGTESLPYFILVDGNRIAGGDPQYRAAWSRFYKKDKHQVRIAIFDIGPVLRVAVEMFTLGSGLRMKAFASEAEARAWLGKAGLNA